jgi:hypothetical protein
MKKLILQLLFIRTEFTIKKIYLNLIVQIRVMFKLNFISEENSNIYYAQNGEFAVKELPEMKEEDGFEVYIDDDEYLDLINTCLRGMTLR